MIVGIISDTHGLLRPAAIAALQGCDMIVHGGDIGSPEVIQALSTIAPTVVIRGNIDKQAWAQEFPETTTAEVCGKRIYVVHSVKDLDFDPAAEGYDVVISGHSHKPGIQEKDGVLFLNPGSAGPRRFKLPVAVATLELTEKGITATIHELEF